jgi:predicted permease
MPADFRFRGEVDVWLPLRLGGGAQRDVRLLTAVGRLAPGHTQAMASAELQGVAARLAQAYPADYRGWGARVEPLRRALDWGAGEGRFVLFGITALVLLVAIMNVAGLLLVRAAVRQHELATRRALGATRMQLWRQQLVEGACLGLGGGLTGILFALWGVRFAVRWFSLESTTFQLGMDRRVLLFASVLAIGGGMVAALLPALRAVRRDPAGSLRVRGVAGGGMGTARTATALIAAQISLGLMLLTAAGLLSADFVALRYVDLGYDPRGLYRTTIHGTREQAADPASWRAVAEAVPARLLEVPGVLAASVEYQSAVHPAIVRAGDGASSSAEMMTPTVKAVNADYFAVWRIPVLLGRAPSAADRAGEPPVAVINRAAAASFWPGRNPLGRTVFLGDSGSVGELLTVVGVTADAERGDMVDRHWPAVYRPLPQARTWHTAARVNIRVAAGRPDVLATAQSVIRQTTDWPPGPFVSEEDALSERLSTRRLNALVLDVFAGFGLLLCAMGVYGSIAFAVTQRTREIGIRMAVGAARRDVFTLFARHGAALALAGVVTGLAGAVALARVFTGFVAGIHVTNPWVFAAAAGLMIGVAFAATLLPARRALRVDPAIALRIE